MRLENNMTFFEYKNALIDIHTKLKKHSFREKFTDTSLKGTWKSLFNEYRKLIYDTTEVLLKMAYHCQSVSPIDKEDTFWIHDFRNWLLTMQYFFGSGKQEEDFTEKLEGLNITYNELLGKTGNNDIKQVMLFLEKYIQYIHLFIETGELKRVAAIEYEPSTKPHNGYYYKHMVEYEKIDGEWKLVEKPKYIGTKNLNKNNKKKGKK